MFVAKYNKLLTTFSKFILAYARMTAFVYETVPEKIIYINISMF